MRTFEIVILVMVLAGQLIALTTARSTHAIKTLRWVYFGLLILILAFHLTLEGAHWQMWPAYLAVSLTVLLLLLPPAPRSPWRIVNTVFALTFVVVSSCLAFILPVFKLPPPTGSFTVGTQIISMVDTSRMEDADPNSQRPRELIVQIWYPALQSHNPRAPYRRRSETSLASSYQSVTWTNSHYDAPVASSAGGFPILLYNPGWNGRRTQNTILTEELASHGYVVVAIDHPYNSGPAALSDSRVIRPVPAPELFDDVTSEASLYNLINKEVAKETTDALFVLKQVEQMNEVPANQFYHRLDLTKIGALGYSLGGTVAAEAAYRNPNIHAVLDLDTPLYGESGQHGITQPFLLLCEELSHSTPDELARMTFGQRRDQVMDEQDYARQLPMLRKPGNYQIAIKGTLHTSFQDGILTSPLQRFSQAGAVPPLRMVNLLRQYSVAFFDQSLRGANSSLLAAKSSPFPEAQVLFTSSPKAAQQPVR